jgi:hypothetical protein
MAVMRRAGAFAGGLWAGPLIAFKSARDVHDVDGGV